MVDNPALWQSYGIPGNKQVRRLAAFIAMNDDGCRLVHHVGHADADGLSCEDDVFRSFDAGALTNPLPNVLIAWFASTSTSDA